LPFQGKLHSCDGHALWPVASFCLKIEINDVTVALKPLLMVSAVYDVGVLTHFNDYAETNEIYFIYLLTVG